MRPIDLAKAAIPRMLASSAIDPSAATGNLRTHGLRHSFASLAVNAGAVGAVVNRAMAARMVLR